MRARGKTLAGAALLMLGTTPAVIASDLQVQVMAGNCAICHGTDGYAPGAMPRIGGRPQAALARQLREFKAGEVEGATVMTRIAKGYSDEQLEALARYFAERPRP